jgi:hypothetical protein
MIGRARPRDLEAVRELLERVHLTLEGIDQHMETMLVARDGGHVVGTATVELYPDGALTSVRGGRSATARRRPRTRADRSRATTRSSAWRQCDLPSDDNRRAVLPKVWLSADHEGRRARLSVDVRAISVCLPGILDRDAEAIGMRPDLPRRRLRDGAGAWRRHRRRTCRQAWL